jgi:hypothetical protein
MLRFRGALDQLDLLWNRVEIERIDKNKIGGKEL